jgi:hypothetical protein
VRRDVEPASPRVEKNIKLHAGEGSHWERVINVEDSMSVQYKEGDLPDLDAEQVPQDREVRAAWNRERLKRLIETEGQREASDYEWHY